MECCEAVGVGREADGQADCGGVCAEKLKEEVVRRFTLPCQAPHCANGSQCQADAEGEQLNERRLNCRGGRRQLCPRLFMRYQTHKGANGEDDYCTGTCG